MKHLGMNMLYIISTVTSVFVYGKTCEFFQYLFLIEETSSENSGSVDVPKALSDVFKAIIAGVFLDCDGDLKIVWNVCCNIMKNELGNYLNRSIIAQGSYLKK